MIPAPPPAWRRAYARARDPYWTLCRALLGAGLAVVAAVLLMAA